MERKRLLCGFLSPLRERTGEGDIVFSLYIFYFSFIVMRSAEMSIGLSTALDNKFVLDKSQGAYGYMLKTIRVILS